MSSFEQRIVTQVEIEREGLQRVLLDDGTQATSLTEIIGLLEVGQRVIVNTTAMDLNLGTGGYHLVHFNLDSKQGDRMRQGRVLKARYLSEQLQADVWEEQDNEAPNVSDLTGMRVLLCQLHSHVGAIAIATSAHRSGPVGFVMTDQASLPLAISDIVFQAKESKVLGVTVTTGQSFGGEIEAVTVASGVLALKERNESTVIVGCGPGHLGTNSKLGFSGLELVGHATILSKLGAKVALAVRASSTDPRERHQGVSHHTRTLLELISHSIDVPIPSDVSGDAFESLGHTAMRYSDPSISGLLSESNINIQSMDRPLFEDTLACEYLGAAAMWLAGANVV
ncbi:MAG TPA: hypothetical protein DCP89_03370 [Acidimicrobiaceae bacterium]|jgi:hypothetical protein|nr:hypothetical protein [Actinomycetota bacterium]NCG40150.1 DUF3866 family protein [Actinomycetota bacterium]HAN07516.1 hypothetical protein [Acidimicrobiaceae bacterium]